MTISKVENRVAEAIGLSVNDESLTVELNDGRTISVPLAWYPRLLHSSPSERSHWRLVGRGQSIHWDDLDEDVSIDNLLSGSHSGESQASLKRWLDSRVKKQRNPASRSKLRTGN